MRLLFFFLVIFPGLLNSLPSIPPFSSHTGGHVIGSEGKRGEALRKQTSRTRRRRTKIGSRYSFNNSTATNSNSGSERMHILFLVLLLSLFDHSSAFSTNNPPAPSSPRRWKKKPKAPPSPPSPPSNPSSPDGSPRMKPRFISPTQAKNPREAAYLAALAADREQAFISDALSEWADAKQPSASEMGLATLIANVACREANSLDYAIGVLAKGGGDGAKEEKGKKREKSVRLKGRQRVVLRTALAQYKWV